MTVSSSTNRVQYNGSGSTGPFTVPFYFLEDSHLLVVKTDTSSVDSTLTLGTDYTVTGSGDPSGGSITLTTALASGEKLTITRNIPLTQETDYVANDAFPADTHERALDKLTMQNQQQDETLDRAIKVPTTASGITTDISLASIQPNYLLRWNSSADQIESVSATAAALSASLTPNANDFIVGDGTDWVNKTYSQVKTILNYTTTDIPEGTNLYYTSARANSDFDTRLGTKTTDDLTEGATNLYHTDERVDDRVAALIQNGTGLTWTYDDVGNTLTGNVALTSFSTDNLSEGATNKYYSTTLFNTDFGGKTTDDLSEGATNLYYTTARVNIDFDTRLATKSTSDLAEGTNLYYTDARVDARINSTSIDALSDVDTTTTPPTSGQILTWNATTSKWEPETAAVPGETNTASNVGVGGVGVFKQKSGVDLEFKNINAGSGKITVTDDTANNEIDIDLGPVALNDLSDVSGTPSTNDVLTYNGTGWAPATVSSGGATLLATVTSASTTVTGLSSYKFLRVIGIQLNDSGATTPKFDFKDSTGANISGSTRDTYSRSISSSGGASIGTWNPSSFYIGGGGYSYPGYCDLSIFTGGTSSGVSGIYADYSNQYQGYISWTPSSPPKVIDQITFSIIGSTGAKWYVYGIN